MLVEFVKWSPLFSMIVFSLVLSFLLTLAYKKLTNQKRLNELKEKQKKLREEMKASKNEPEKIEKLQKEMLDASMENMRLSFKPMLITFIPLILAFYGLRVLYTDMAGVGNIISWGANLPIVGDGAGWLLCYIIFSFIASILFRKLFRL
ncbi:MAG: EMC3/TMCO1 family protein [Candidatus Pacearchaeota archaeon]|nr:EMC3/TMCO1 family protein [Candidatus Pacearchaeota archaeon]